MHTASLELCKELYELSGGEKTLKSWHHTSLAWAPVAVEHKPPAKPVWEPRVVRNDFQALCDFTPAYDLGFLLRRLEGADGRLWMKFRGHDYVFKWDDRSREYYGDAETPEDALCKLAIQLINQGVINPKQEKQ